MRVAELEGELGDANDTIARLKGEAAPEVASVSDGHDWVTGSPRELALERELPFEVSDDGFEAIADICSQRLPGGSVSLVGRTFTYRHGQFELRVSRADGKTSVRARAVYEGARLVFALASMGIAVLGGGFVVGVAEPLGVASALMVPLFVLGAVLGIVGLRQLLKRGNAKGRETLTGLFETACDLVKEHQRDEPPAKTRVVLVDEAEREVLASEEAAEAEASLEAAENQSSSAS